MGEETIETITERMLGRFGHGPFHLSDGVFLWRESDGIHLAIAADDIPGSAILRHLVFGRSSWASAVAVTTSEGENATTFRIADALIGPPYQR